MIVTSKSQVPRKSHLDSTFQDFDFRLHGKRSKVSDDGRKEIWPMQGIVKTVDFTVS